MIFQDNHHGISSIDETVNSTYEYIKLFVGQIPKETTEVSLKECFEEFGPVAELSIIRDNSTMISKGCAFVSYYYQESALEAIDNLHDKIKLPNSLNTLQVRIAESQVERENKLFIGMLPKAMDDHDLHQMFVSYGELREVHVIKGMDGSPKGCAFIKFADRNSAIAAIEDLNGTIPPGASRAIVVKFADCKKQGKVMDYWENPQTNTSNAMYTYPQTNQQQMFGMSYIAYNGSNQIPNPPMTLSVPVSPSAQHQRFMYMQNQVGYYSQSPSYNIIPVSDYGPVEHQSQNGSTFSGKMNDQNILSTKANIQNTHNLAHDFYSHSNNAIGTNKITSGVNHSQYNEEVSAGLQVGNSDQDLNGSRPPEGPSGANLFIYHLPRDLIDADLATLFAPFGNVISAKVFVDKKTSDSKGFGFVSYDTLESANAAIESMNGFQIGTKRLKVQHKRTIDSSDNLMSSSHNQVNNTIDNSICYDNYSNRSASNTVSMSYQHMMGNNTSQINGNGQIYNNAQGNNSKHNVYGNYSKSQQYFGTNRNQY